ncbi:hypothetical protein ACFX11_027972 [Malus domestica]
MSLQLWAQLLAAPSHFQQIVRPYLPAKSFASCYMPTRGQNNNYMIAEAYVGGAGMPYSNTAEILTPPLLPSRNNTNTSVHFTSLLGRVLPPLSTSALTYCKLISTMSMGAIGTGRPKFPALAVLFYGSGLAVEGDGGEIFNGGDCVSGDKFGGRGPGMSIQCKDKDPLTYNLVDPPL